jgi:hypothetical protein
MISASVENWKNDALRLAKAGAPVQLVAGRLERRAIRGPLAGPTNRLCRMSLISVEQQRNVSIEIRQLLSVGRGGIQTVARALEEDKPSFRKLFCYETLAGFV